MDGYSLRDMDSMDYVSQFKYILFLNDRGFHILCCCFDLGFILSAGVSQTQIRFLRLILCFCLKEGFELLVKMASWSLAFSGRRI